LYAEISALADDGNANRISLSDDTSSNRLVIGYTASNNLEAFFVVNGVNQAYIPFTIDITNNNKIAVSYKLNDFSLWVNGSKVGTDTSVIVPSINTLNELQFKDSIGVPFFGNTKDVQVYTKALSDAELIKLTT